MSKGRDEGRPSSGTGHCEQDTHCKALASRAGAKSLWTADAGAAIRVLKKMAPLPFVFREHASLAEKASYHRTGGP